MTNSAMDTTLQILIATAIIAGTRWLLTAPGESLPKTTSSMRIYRIKRPVRAVGYLGLLFFSSLTIWILWGIRSPKDSLLLIVPICAVAVGIWVISGSVVIDETGITRKTLWHRLTLRWPEVTEVRFHEKAGAIEVLSGLRSLTIDSRFAARDDLLQEIESRTNLGRSDGNTVQMN